MKLFTLLILACVGVILFGFLNENKPGNPGHGPGAAGAPGSSAWPSSASPAKFPTTASSDSSSPGVASSVLAFFKRGLSTPGHRTSWQRDELRIARGIVVDQLDTGLVLDCSGWVVQSARNPGVYAGDGRGMSALDANLVDTDELLRFGHLMAVDHGHLVQSDYDPASWTPTSYLQGPVLVKGYPLASPGPGKGFKVVVAPDGNVDWRGQPIPACTASFTLGN